MSKLFYFSEYRKLCVFNKNTVVNNIKSWISAKLYVMTVMGRVYMLCVQNQGCVEVAFMQPSRAQLYLRFIIL